MSKYLELAKAMYKNRGDWSDGYSYVRDELRHFKVENDLDKLIVCELREIINESDIPDGRYFRDCVYNYNWIADNLLTKEEKNEFSNGDWLKELY